MNSPSTSHDTNPDMNPAMEPYLRAALRHLPDRIARNVLLFLRATLRWFNHDGPQLGAAIAFYTMFAMAPLLLIAIVVAGAVFGEDAARGHIVSQIAGLIGKPAAEGVEAMVKSAWRHPNGMLAGVLGVLTLLAGATGVFTQLRRALNVIGHIDSVSSVWTTVLRARLVGLALVLGFGFLAIVSLLLSALLTAFSDFLQQRYTGLSGVFTLVDVVISTAVLTLAFAVLMRWVPDTAIRWKAAWLGAVVSAVLFSVGKHLIGLYLARAGVASSYGAAGSFVVLMLWVYYSAQILLFGYALAVCWNEGCASMASLEQGIRSREATEAHQA